MAHSLITPDSKKNFNLDLGDHLGRGATADVYKVQIDNKFYAVKIYKKPNEIDWLKLKAITELGYQDDYAFVKTHAWPIGIIQKNSKNIGFAMELFDLGLFRTIDHYYDNLLRSKIKDIRLLALPNLILIAKNLCIELDKLHKKKIFLVDVKPQNIAINTTTNEVVILDCDGFAFEKDGDRFPAGFVSADYIAPEITINKLSPTTQGLGQDLYALSVIIFQILNRSLHPYSGISKKDTEASTNDDKAALGQYAYGAKANKNIKPHVSSLHEMWDDRILDALENCFTGGHRTSAAEWVAIFENIERDKGYVRCDKLPEDALHIKFRDKECMQCKLDRLQATHTPAPPPKPKPEPPKTKYTPPQPSNIKNGPPWYLIIVVAIAAFIYLLQYDGESNRENKTCSATTPEYCNSQTLCMLATTGSGSKRTWVKSGQLLPYATEAKKRGFMCGTAQSNSGGSSIPTYVKSMSDDVLCAFASKLEKAGSTKRRWETNTTFQPHVKEAKRRGLYCGTKGQAIVQNTCGQNPALCTTAEICQKSTYLIGNDAHWSKIMPNHVWEAKKRGLDCGVKTTVVNSGGSSNTASLRSLSADTLCIFASKLEKVGSTKRIWETQTKYKAHVKEAKRRGLHCGVKTQVATSSTNCASNPKSCLDKGLCNLSTRRQNGRKVWETSLRWRNHAKEAKRRGLDCGVKTQVATSSTNCASNPKSCLDKGLCNLSTRRQNGRKVWETSLKWRNHAKEAKRRGLDCGVKTTVANSGGSSNTASLRSLSADTLCIFASKLEKAGSAKRIWETQTKYKAHVKEAKRRGLHCGVNKKTTASNAQTNNNSGNLRTWTNSRICSTATVAGSWEKRSIYQPHVKEAKRRGLHCGVSNQYKSVKTVDLQKIKEMSPYALCQAASIVQNGTRRWKNDPDSKHYVAEAKYRNLKCGKFENVKSISAEQICADATILKDGERRWTANPKFKDHVKEAKYRSLTCGVGSVQKGDIKEFRNMEIKGSNLISYALQGGSKSQCISKCLNSNSCRAISYEKRTKSCWLKMQTLPLIHSPGTDSVKFLK